MDAYGIYRPRTRHAERVVVYALCGVGDIDEAADLWPRGYRRVATVSAGSPYHAALLGDMLMGDVLVPPRGAALLLTGQDRLAPLDRPAPRRS